MCVAPKFDVYILWFPQRATTDHVLQTTEPVRVKTKATSFSAFPERHNSFFFIPFSPDLLNAVRAVFSRNSKGAFLSFFFFFILQSPQTHFFLLRGLSFRARSCTSRYPHTVHYHFYMVFFVYQHRISNLQTHFFSFSKKTRCCV